MGDQISGTNTGGWLLCPRPGVNPGVAVMDGEPAGRGNAGSGMRATWLWGPAVLQSKIMAIVEGKKGR